MHMHTRDHLEIQGNITVRTARLLDAYIMHYIAIVSPRACIFFIFSLRTRSARLSRAAVDAVARLIAVRPPHACRVGLGAAVQHAPFEAFCVAVGVDAPRDPAIRVSHRLPEGGIDLLLARLQILQPAAVAGVFPAARRGTPRKGIAREAPIRRRLVGLVMTAPRPACIGRGLDRDGRGHGVGGAARHVRAGTEVFDVGAQRVTRGPNSRRRRDIRPDAAALRRRRKQRRQHRPNE